MSRPKLYPLTDPYQPYHFGLLGNFARGTNYDSSEDWLSKGNRTEIALDEGCRDESSPTMHLVKNVCVNPHVFLGDSELIVSEPLLTRLRPLLTPDVRPRPVVIERWYAYDFVTGQGPHVAWRDATPEMTEEEAQFDDGSAFKRHWRAFVARCPEVAPPHNCYELLLRNVPMLEARGYTLTRYDLMRPHGQTSYTNARISLRSIVDCGIVRVGGKLVRPDIFEVISSFIERPEFMMTARYQLPNE